MLKLLKCCHEKWILQRKDMKLVMNTRKENSNERREMRKMKGDIYKTRSFYLGKK